MLNHIDMKLQKRSGVNNLLEKQSATPSNSIKIFKTLVVQRFHAST
jgi:hypothetical protein